MTINNLTKDLQGSAQGGKGTDPKGKKIGPSFVSLKYVQVFDRTPIGIVRFDSDARVTMADENAIEILGISFKALKGEKWSELSWQMMDQNGQEIKLTEFLPELALRLGKVIPNEVVGIQSSDESSVRWLLVTAIPLMDLDDQNKSQVLCQIQDITDVPKRELQIELRLKSLQEFLQSVLILEAARESADKVYREIVNFLPNIFSFPQNTQAKIFIDENEYLTENFKESDVKVASQIKEFNGKGGKVEFHYQVDDLNALSQEGIESDKVMVDKLAEWLGLVCQSIGQTKEIEILKEQALSSYDRTIEALSAVLESQEREPEGHTNRVTELALELAREMGFEGEELNHIRRGALLHDIGKISVPEEILQKPGKLTEDEFQTLKKHPEFTKKWLSQIELLKPVLQIPYYHHENWDGTGYPQGLIGEEIPLVARMFAVVDVWDALISDRPYRKAMSRDEALDLILAESGSHFDPDVVEHFLKVLSRGDYIVTSHEIKIKAFGQARVWIRNQRITTKDWQVHAARDLFFLFLSNPAGMTKEQVGIQMWPDASTEELDVRFKNTLYRLRHAVGSDVILLDDNFYHFNRMLDYVYDVETLMTMIENAKSEFDLPQKIAYLKKAVRQYAGEYLPEVDEIWALVDRERYHLLYLNALVQLAEYYYDLQDFVSAKDWAKQALVEDPVNESVHRIIMRIHAENGNRAEVVRQFEACRAALNERFNVSPSQKTQDLYESLIEK